MPVYEFIAENRRSAIGMAIGAASVCWVPRPSGTFDSEEAEHVVDGLVRALATHDEPNLGLATTEQLLKELQARGELNRTSNSQDRAAMGVYLQAQATILLGTLPRYVLEYRTVDS